MLVGQTLSKIMNKIIYKSHFEIISKLTDEQAGQLIKKIGNPNYEISDQLVLGIYMGMSFDFQKQEENYSNIVERNRENGKKGGRPKKPITTQETQSLSKKPTEPKGFSENPKNLKDKDKDRDKDRDKEIDKEDIEHIMNLKGISESEAIQYIKSLIEDKSVQEKKVEDNIFSMNFD